MVKQILVCVAWPYANGPRHIGHVAGFGVPSDVFARYQRMVGNEVLMISGTDEFGTPITVQADEEGVSPQELVDRYQAIITEDLFKLGLSYDLFSRTTTDNHRRLTQDFFQTLHSHKQLFPKTAMGAFSSTTGATLPDRYIEGTCPHCGDEGARGDQCDHCGKQLDPEELLNPYSRIDGKAPVFKESEHFFLDLPAFSKDLRSWLEKQTHWRPNVRGFSLSMLDNLKSRAVTRDISWGIPIPLAEYQQRKDKRIYVWFDAVIGYFSASVEWAARSGKPDDWRRWWQNPKAEHFYFMGKDNVVFHSLIWPSMLIGFGNGLPSTVCGGKGEKLQLPSNVVSSEFLTMEGRKFSSSRGVVIYVRDFLKRYDPDTLRFFLTIAGPETQDTDFTWAEFVRRNNDELVASWGNLVHRVLSMNHRHFGATPNPPSLEEAEETLLNTIDAGFAQVGALIEGCSLKAAIHETLRLVDEVNRYLNRAEPWRLLKDPANKPKAQAVLYAALCAINNLKLMMAPFLPFSCQRLHEMFGYQDSLAGERRLEEVAQGNRSWKVISGDYRAAHNRWQPTRLPKAHPLPAPQPLFKKLDPSVAEQELETLSQHFA